MVEASHINDLQLLAISALRYALPRQTYITGWTVEVIMRLDDGVFDEKTTTIMLRDVGLFLDDCDKGIRYYHDCDYDVFCDLENWLKDKAVEKKLNITELDGRTLNIWQRRERKYTHNDTDKQV